jgi:hypothetical protein
MIRIILGGFNEWAKYRFGATVGAKSHGWHQGRAREPHNTNHLCQRPSGHDLRYAIDANKINTEQGGNPQASFLEQGLNEPLVFRKSNVNETMASVHASFQHEWQPSRFRKKCPRLVHSKSNRARSVARPHAQSSERDKGPRIIHSVLAA